MRRLLIRMLGCLFALISMPAMSSDWHPYSVMGLGFSYTNQTQRLTLQASPAPGLVNQYESAKTSASTKLVGFGVSKIMASANAESDFSVGMEALYMRNDEVPGMIRPLINVGFFDTLNFSYDMSSLLLLAKATMNTAHIIKEWGGYLDFGAGASINRLSSYLETTPSGSTAIPMSNPFGNKTNTQFAFSVGAGFTHKVATRSEVSIGYRYINTGKGLLDTSSSQGTSERLSFKDFGRHLLTFAVRV